MSRLEWVRGGVWEDAGGCGWMRVWVDEWVNITAPPSCGERGLWLFALMMSFALEMNSIVFSSREIKKWFSGT